MQAAKRVTLFCKWAFTDPNIICSAFMRMPGQALVADHNINKFKNFNTMTKITAADINKLRQMTGAGMMDCKAALTEVDGDFQQAIDWLRKKGQKVAEKRADREANEGVVLAKTNESQTYGCVLMMNCETDFVAKNEAFRDFAMEVLPSAVAHQPADLEGLKALELDGRSVADHVAEQVER
jgi:elongation factor Ts